VDAAKNYCKRVFADKLPILDGSRSVHIDWDSSTGDDLIQTMVLSDNAKRFLLRRDLCDRQSYWGFTNSAFTWASCSSIASAVVYLFDRNSRRLNQSLVGFVVLYSVCMAAAYVGHRQFYLFRDFMLRRVSDSQAKSCGSEYVLGAREYYWKLLKRNRIIRQLIGGTESLRLYSASGSPRSAVTDYATRFADARDWDDGIERDPEIGELDDSDEDWRK
jgi:hypothetical protein